jgi:hypothetical protein
MPTITAHFKKNKRLIYYWHIHLLFSEISMGTVLVIRTNSLNTTLLAGLIFISEYHPFKSEFPKQKSAK